MNSEKKLYEELVKYHPEFKDSQEDIKKVVSALVEMNPQIRIDQQFSDQLKNKLLSVADYKQPKKSGMFKFFAVLVPMFSLGFAVFWFWYLQDDQWLHQEVTPYMLQGWAAPAQMRMDISEDFQDPPKVKMMESEMYEVQSDEPEALEMMMMDSTMIDDISDDFKLTCEDNLWEISRLDNGDRVCTTKQTTCLEFDFEQQKCNFKN